MSCTVPDDNWHYQVFEDPPTPAFPPVPPQQVDPVARLRELADELADDPNLEAQHDVYRRFGPLFAWENLDHLSVGDFEDFLKYENNMRWRGIERNRSRVTGDPALLRAALRLLLDEERTLTDRLNWLWPFRAPLPMPGMGPALISPILHVAHPDRYGVWNSGTTWGLSCLALLPDRQPEPGRGTRYAMINATLVQLADEVDVDLWTLELLLQHVSQRRSRW